MDIVKVIPEKYLKQIDLSNEIRYVTNSEKTKGIIGGWALTPHDSEQMIYQSVLVFIRVQTIFTSILYRIQ